MAGRSISINIDVSGNNGNYDFWVVKLEHETLGVNHNFINEAISIHLNPVSQTLYFSTKQTLENVVLFDLLGKEVYASKHSNQIDVSLYQQGIYLLKVMTNRGKITKK